MYSRVVVDAGPFVHPWNWILFLLLSLKYLTRRDLREDLFWLTVPGGTVHGRERTGAYSWSPSGAHILMDCEAESGQEMDRVINLKSHPPVTQFLQ